MNVSFGKFIPVRVFLDGKEIVNKNPKVMDQDIKQLTLAATDCFSKANNYPNTFLAEQQRRFFASQVDDYELPKRSATNRSDILPSTVKTVNVDGKRFLTTGMDIFFVKELGHELGLQQKKNSEETDRVLSSRAEDMSPEDYDKLHSTITGMRNMAAKGQRQEALKELAEQRKISKTLYINASSNPDGKLLRDKYKINYIDFK